jgi:dihydrolipoamide dehydrogenase
VSPGARRAVSAEDKGGEPFELKADKVLVAVGRRPYLEGANLDALGLEMDGPRVRIDAHFRTSVDGVYAIGDIVHGPMLAHKAEDEGMAVAEVIAGKAGHVNYETIPNVIYTWPEAASVGRTEEQLKEAGTSTDPEPSPSQRTGAPWRWLHRPDS